jgi:hypothetical protein
MSFTVYGTEYEGKTIHELLPWIGGSYGPPDQARYLKSYLEKGGQVYLEITQGARKGTVGRLVITPEQCMEYTKLEGGYHKDKFARRMTGLHLAFDDRKTTIPVDMDWYRPKKLAHVLCFTPTVTTWVYTSTAKPKEAVWTPKDFFGNVIAKDSLVFFSANDGVQRIGRVERWSNKGTMWVEVVKMKAGTHQAPVLTHGVMAHNMILVDAYPDLKAAVTLKKLAG